VWLVFIGHGAPAKSDKDGVPVGADAQQTTRSLQTRSIAQKELLSLLGKGDQGRTRLVVDACFSGRTSGGDALATGAQPVVPVVEPEVLGFRWLAPFQGAAR
jgi:hypothetical protein